MFGCMPRLKRLDVSEIPLLSRHLPEILRAASRCCPRLEFLLMPRKDDCFFVVKEPIIRWLMTALVAALETWFSTGRCGGLKQLTMPTCDEGNERSTTQYIEAMARFCPGIEYIDGFKQVLLDGHEECPDVRSFSLETWQAFNASCTALRSFNWTLVPFGDQFFRVFGEHVKPQLTSLSLTANMCRNYENYLRQYPGSVTRVDEWDTHPGYGTSCRNPGEALRGCPALKMLIIEIDHSKNEESYDRYADPFVCGVEFWKAVATHCPRLETIDMVDSSIHPLFYMRPIDTLTTRTLVTLAGLKSLRHCTLAPARLTGEAIFEYLRCVSRSQSYVAKRAIDISIGGHEKDEVLPRDCGYLKVSRRYK